jgi:hypothetical protein
MQLTRAKRILDIWGTGNAGCFEVSGDRSRPNLWNCERFNSDEQRQLQDLAQGQRPYRRPNPSWHRRVRRTTTGCLVADTPCPAKLLGSITLSRRAEHRGRQPRKPASNPCHKP